MEYLKKTAKTPVTGEEDIRGTVLGSLGGQQHPFLPVGCPEIT
jgi:hypothetical protein